MKSSRCSTQASNEVREGTMYCSGSSSADMPMDTEEIPFTIYISIIVLVKLIICHTIKSLADCD